MYAFEALHEEDSAARAERAFYVRSVTELRRAATFTPPIFFAAVVGSAVALGAPGWFVGFLATFLMLSVVGPLAFYIARPIMAKKLARKYPVRTVRLSSEAIEIIVGTHTTAVIWNRIKHVWETNEHILLVLGKFGCIALPRRNLPEGAIEFMRKAVANAA